MKVENLEMCPSDSESPIKMQHFDVSRPGRLKYALNATMVVSKEIKSQLYVSVTRVCRCNWLAIPRA